MPMLDFVKASGPAKPVMARPISVLNFVFTFFAKVSVIFSDTPWLFCDDSSGIPKKVFFEVREYAIIEPLNIFDEPAGVESKYDR
ncbi:MAG: hypothetical protein PHP69_04245 [Candidatus Omnitrophica bacterium]|nr:hypothetical protein [Candidatus Omnitrophota bacterium]MDD5080994.1 hypothetical protein [Candidatus Omnitrophota bacterium]MDD5441510.1 hypothetical protein [Candidatus Omnitrophota bacterium]